MSDSFANNLMWIAIVVTAVCAVYLVLKTLSLSRRVKEELCNPTLTKKIEQKYLKAAEEREQKNRMRSS